MSNPALQGNIRTVMTGVKSGQTVDEAENELFQQLIENDTAEDVAKLRSKAAADVVRERLAKIYDERDPRIAVNPLTRHERWYPGPMENDYLWPRYRARLVEKGYTPETVEQIHSDTNRITSNLGSPSTRKFRRQGLVVGRVQSGKTSNFMGLLAKSGDVGYRMIIVLAGTTNTLRYQTQERLQNELIGFDDKKWRWLTQAKCDPATLRVDPLGEFNEIGTASHTMSNPGVRVIAVIKKNVTVLTRLRRWFTGIPDIEKEMCPVLIVDDECDNASINTRGPDEDPARINGEIRDILAMLPKVSYVGYTATPFANVLTNPDAEAQDLYPRDFLFALPLNPEYFGPERIFGRDSEGPHDLGAEGNDIVRTITPEESDQVCPAARTAMDTFAFETPPSLVQATRYFLLNSAARIVREKCSGRDLEFKSMLVNTAPWVRVHRMTKPKMDELLKILKADFANKPAEWEAHWNEESEKVQQEQIGCKQPKVTWQDLSKELTPEFFGGIKVIVSNSSPNEASNLNAEYHKKNCGRVLVVIGGNTLSRGITLEGLTVSYFVRKSSAYDTLLQMGRWFGYRKDYEDMPRVWMTAEMEDQFRRLSGVEMDMFNELQSFMTGKSPAEVGLRIRQCPGMQITARAKLIYARQCSIDYSGHMENSTFLFRKDKVALEKNIKAVESLITRVGGADKFTRRSQHLLARGVDKAEVIKFLEEYAFHPKNQKLDATILKKYIAGQNDQGRCITWNLAIKTRNDDDKSGFKLAGLAINRLQLPRSKNYGEEPFAYVQNLSTREDIFADAEDPLAMEEQSKTSSRQEVRGNYEDGVGLIVLYPIHKDSLPGPNSKTRLKMDAAADPIGIAIYFPGNPKAAGQHDYVYVTITPPTPVIEDEDENEQTIA
jgi:hypothetical protein